MAVIGLRYRDQEWVADKLRRRAAILRAEAEALEAIAARLEAAREYRGPILPPIPESAGKEA